jgi:N-acetylglucosaminyldiphosphoundecaprenol N-acetyl-beta-D-mannosaminyltransferase
VADAAQAAAQPTGASPVGVRDTRPVLGVPIDVLDWAQALQRIGHWAARHESRVVCICNAHSVVTAGDDPAFMRVLAAADMATADGAPIAWLMRRLGCTGQARINGPDLMLRYCEQAQASGESIFLYGSSEDTLRTLCLRLRERWPALKIAGSHSPPYRAPTAEEDATIADAINASGAGTVWVSLGCPKQELWMAGQRGRIRAVMVGVGAAFDYHAGTLRRAPPWMQHAGLEWLFRLLSEPRRLWRRYLVTNTAFVARAARQLLSGSGRGG